jgi:AcrR family transcriptional regulator
MSPRRARAVRSRVGDDPATALREHLIATAEKLLGERQVATLTTRDIARAAGVSDGVLYNYFADKHELLVAALVRRYAASVAQYEADLPAPGTGSVEDNLLVYAKATVDLVAETLPTAAGLLAEPALLQGLMEAIHQQPYGPQQLHRPIADYLAGEQRLGRLGDFDIDAAIVLIVGPALVLGFSTIITGTPRDEFVQHLPGIIHTLLAGLHA